MTYASLYHVGKAPQDSDELKTDVIYGASRSMVDLSSQVGIGSFMEYLSTASLTIRHTTSDVTGEKERNRSGVEMSRNTGGGAPSVAALTSETF